MEEKRITCIVCPVGCTITVRGNGGDVISVTGHACSRGEAYAVGEYTMPARILTSSVRVDGADVPLVSVRSTGPLPKDLLLHCVRELRGVRLRAPVSMHDTVLRDILGTGVDVIATSGAN